jgi:hypothetical protein
MNRSLRKWGERGIGAFKYIIALYFMLAGVLTPMMGMETENLGYLYSDPVPLAVFGLVIFLSGLLLFLGKLLKHRKMTGQGLLATFCCFVFFGVLNSMAYGAIDPGNFIGAAIMAWLYLRWRFKTAYINPNHFKPDVENYSRLYPPKDIRDQRH